MQQLFCGFGRLIVPLGTLLLLVQCGGEDLTLPGDTGAAEIELVDGNDQDGTAGERLSQPIVVKVVDRRGEPVPGQRVAFAVVTDPADADVDPEIDETNADGRAEALWTVGSVAGTQQVVATIVGLDGPEVTFTADVGPSSAVRIDPVSGDDQTAAVGTAVERPLVVRVVDRFGNPVPGIRVDWETDQGSVEPASVTTGADGQAVTSHILSSSPGDHTARASSSGLEPVTFISHAVPGRADRLMRVSGDNQSAAPGAQLPKALVVRLVDAAGNGVPGRPVSWVVGAGGGQVESPNSNTDGNGEASTHWTLGSSGTNTLNAVVSGVGFVSFTAIASVTGGGGSGGGDGGADNGDEPARLIFTVQPSRSKEDKQISPPVEVVVVDRDGDRVTNREIEIKLDLIGDDNDKLKGRTREQTESGVARFTDLRVEKEGEYRLRASADGLPSVESDRFEVEDD